MRLQSEEQNEQVMSRMVLTQKQLEQQIRNLTSKGKPASTITTMTATDKNNNGNHTTAAGGLSSNAITPINSEDNTMGNNNMSDSFAEFVKEQPPEH